MRCRGTKWGERVRCRMCRCRGTELNRGVWRRVSDGAGGLFCCEDGFSVYGWFGVHILLVRVMQVRVVLNRGGEDGEDLFFRRIGRRL